ncbi:MAG: hypothetical protein AAGF01_03220 [Cyanobacteria bacterium P01_G01_bin.38]
MSDILLLISVGIWIFAILFLFLDLGVAMIFFLIGVVPFSLRLLYIRTPAGKKEVRKANELRQKELEEEKKKKQEESKKKKDFEEKLARMNGRLHLSDERDRLLGILEDLPKEKAKFYLKPYAINLLSANPLNDQWRERVFILISKKMPVSPSRNELTSIEVYEEVLKLLELHPEELKLRPFALKVGRWHYAKSRPDRKVTIYDEQAIQNDIQVRSKS